jgi:hypothetical protein
MGYQADGAWAERRRTGRPTATVSVVGKGAGSSAWCWFMAASASENSLKRIAIDTEKKRMAARRVRIGTSV